MTDSDGNELGKVFIGGLSQATNDDSLRNYFCQFGKIEDCVVMMDNKTGRSRGFGYIKFHDELPVHQVLDSGPHLLDGKIIDAKQCNIHMKGRNRRSLKIFVGGIGLDDNDETIRQFFSQFGNVTDVNLMLDQSKQRHRGFAFVGFDDESVVKDLIIKHFVTMNGKCVEIKAMEPPNFARKLVVSNENETCTNSLPNMYLCNSLTSDSLQTSLAQTNQNDLTKSSTDDKLLRMVHPHYSIQPLVWNNNSQPVWNNNSQPVWNNPYQFDKIVNPNCVYPTQPPQTNSCHYHQCLTNPNQPMWTMMPSQPTNTYNNYHQLPINSSPLINYPPTTWQYPYFLQFAPQFRPIVVNSTDQSNLNPDISTDPIKPTDINQTTSQPSNVENSHQDSANNNWIYSNNPNSANLIENHSKIHSNIPIGEPIIKPNGDDNNLTKHQQTFQNAFTDFSFFQSSY